MATRDQVVRTLEKLREQEDDSDILEHLVYNWFSSDDAQEALEDYANDRNCNID